MATRGEWGVAGLRRRCAKLRTALQRARVTTDEEIATYWPGGEANGEASSLGRWIYCYANLVRLMGRTEGTDTGPDIAPVLDAALAAEPRFVRCTDGITRPVYPKSFHALRFLDTLDRSVIDAAVRVDALPDTPGAAKAAALLPLVESLAVRLWAWILTEGGPEGTATLPFDEAENPEPPAWTRAMTPEDVVQLAKAHIDVNGRRLRLIGEAFPPDATSQSRLSLSGFLGTAAQELGVRPADVLRRWSLGEVFAQQVAAAQANREARATAEARAAGSRA